MLFVDYSWKSSGSWKNIWFAGCKASIYFYVVQSKYDIAAWQEIKWFMRRKWFNESRPINITPLLKTIVILITELQQRLWIYWKHKVLFSLGRIDFLREKTVTIPTEDSGCYPSHITYCFNNGREILRRRKKETFTWLFFFLISGIC